ncbi:hypothetical protein SNE40_010532 [Patella caerulea]|uniref:Protein phosphatase 1 regulatory subunit 14C n=1 Tax=Patella caerulea TaxID=87958 RepID=A0AAN8Q533_PATCE
MSRKLFRKSVGFYEVEPMATSYSSPAANEQSYASNNIESSFQQRSPQMSDHTAVRSSPGSNSKIVNFHEKREEDKVKKQKYLTAKYGQHQMMLIRKRLAVEDWIYEELRKLYNCQSDSEDHSCPLDLEEVLNYDTDNEKRNYVLESLTDCNMPQHEVQSFVEELLRRSKTL